MNLVTVRAGWLVRGQVRRELEEFLFLHEVEHEIREVRGLLESSFLLRLYGDKGQLAAECIESWVADA